MDGPPPNPSSSGGFSSTPYTTEYDDHGYINYLTPNYGSNPWSSQAGSQQNQYMASASAAAMPNQGQGYQNLQTQLQQYQSQYPSFPNSMGLGSQVPYQSTAQPQQAPLEPTNTSRGFNPWSLQGEALSR